MTAAQFQQQFGSIANRAQGSEPKAQIRIPRQPQPNKTEAAWMEQARRIHPGAIIRYEPFTLRLPSGTRYTPDVVAIAPDGSVLAIYEVKGPHIHNARSIHALKEAKAAFPFWTFHFSQLTKDGWATA